MHSCRSITDISNNLTMSALVPLVFHKMRHRFIPPQNELLILLGLVSGKSSSATSTL